MATTTWPATTSVAFLSGEGVETLLGTLFDRQQVLMGRGVTLAFNASAALLATTWTLMQSCGIRAPSCLGAVPVGSTSHRIRAAVLVYANAGSSLLEFKIRDNAAALDGKVVNMTGTTATILESVITVPDGTWASTNRTIEFWLRCATAQMCNVETSGLFGSLRFGD